MSRTGQTLANNREAISIQFDQWVRGVRERDPELAHRIVKVLRRLNVIASGGTSKYAVDKTSTGKPGTTPPPGAFSKREEDKSLFHDYLKHFLDARNDQALWVWVEEAEVAAEIAEGGSHGKIGGGPALEARVRAARRDGDEVESDEDAAERVISWYEGDPAYIAAMKEGNKFLEGWVRKVRRSARRDGETGVPLPDWHGWDDDTRIVEVGQRRNKGLSQGQASVDLGISDRTIRKYWTRKKAA